MRSPEDHRRFLHTAVKTQLGWTFAHLARLCGVHPTTIYDVCNFKELPSPKLADSIQRVLGEAGVFIDVLEMWPATQQPPDAEASQALHSRDPKEASSFTPVEFLELEETMREILHDFSPREREILDLRFGYGLNRQEVADRIPSVTPGRFITRERVRQIEIRSLRRLRYEEHLRKLRPFAIQ
jgi:RNA polymerase nonessential primary-like sigma factor